MRRFLLLALLALSLPAGAQTSLFRHAGKKNVTRCLASSPMKAAIVDEATDLQDDNNVKYRYVYAYNKDQERSSETIYRREREDGSWGSETLIAVGTYSYEYDSQGRMKTKAVSYSDNDYFCSFRIMAEYGDETTAYKKYEVASDGTYCLTEEWEYYPNGVMASHTDCSDDSYSIKKFYSENGSQIGLERSYPYSGESNSIINSGALNDSVHTTRYVSGDYRHSYVKTYKYDPAHDFLLEYSDYEIDGDSTCYGNLKYEWEYDELGRLISEKYYDGAQDDEDVGPMYVRGVAASSAAIEPEWLLLEQTDYTYNSDEVFGVGNAWHDVLNFDGPVKAYRFWERNTEEDSEEADVDFVETIDFEYDSSGKLLSATHTQTGPMYDMSHVNMIISVDDEGHITYVAQNDCFYNTDGTIDESDYSETQFEYVWQDGQVTKKTVEDRDLYDNTLSTSTTTYSYGDGSVTMEEEYSNSSYTTYIEKKDGRYYEFTTRQYDDSSSQTDKIIVETQTEDVIFVRPNIFKDVDGFTPERTIVASVKDRVVAFSENKNLQDSWEYRHVNYGMLWSDTPFYANMTDSTYFSIAHDGDETVCYNIDGLPVYVLEDGKLVKEFQYYEEFLEVSPEPAEGDSTRAMLPRRVTVTDSQGYAYDEIVYLYNDDGLLIGRTLTEVSEDGTREEQISVEYKYDPTGVTSREASAGVGVQINGRRLGICDPEQTFSVTTLGGAQLASGAREFTFGTPGIYLVTVNGKTMKLLVK